MKNESNTLYVGAARVKIEIPDDFFPYKSFRGRYYIGQHDDIYARCIILGNPQPGALILSIELGDLGDIARWQEKISKASGVPAGNILLTVTHTHEAPHVSDSWHQTVADVEKTALFGKCAEQAALAAVEAARKNMKPGRLAYGTGRCDINVNRNLLHQGRYIIGANPHGVSDKTVAVIRFEDLQGEPVAYFINYAVHGCVMFWLGPDEPGMYISGDLPGETSRYIEQRHDDRVVALWTSGAAGDQNPKYMADRITFDSKGEIKRVNAGVAGGYLLAQVQAETLADEVLMVAASMTGASPKAVIKGIQKKFMVPGQQKVEDLGKTDDAACPDAPPVEMQLSLLLINHIALVGIPGEAVCSIGMTLKNSLPYRNVVVVNHCNGSISYISDEAGYEKRMFAAHATHLKRGCAEPAILGGAAAMFEELEGAP